MGHIPVGMEMFSAADDTQWQLIQRQIEVSDYHVVIVAHRYGSMDGDTSYTEKEYDYAVSLGVPALGFVLRDEAPWPRDQVDKEPQKIAALAAFKEKVKKRLISYWSSEDDLHGRVSVALVKQFTATPRDGWVRASSIASPQVASELGRISQENRELREALAKAQRQEVAMHDSAIEKVIETLKVNMVDLDVFYQDATGWTREAGRTLFELFYIMAPDLMVEQATEDAARLVGVIWGKKGRKVRPNWPVPSNAFMSWIADLAALDLVEPSTMKHAVADKKQYWRLSEFGKSAYTVIRKRRLERGLPSGPVKDVPEGDLEEV